MKTFGIWRTTYKTADDAKWFRHNAEINREKLHVGEVAESDVTEECRPDWGVYHPVVTLLALERHIRKAGLVPDCADNQGWSYGFIGI